MPWAIWVVLGWGVFVILTAVVITYLMWRRGGWREIEEPKYRMLEDREPEEWPGRTSRGGGPRHA